MSDIQGMIYDLQKGQEKYDFRNKQAAKSMVIPGLNESIIREISESKREPQWMLEQRINAFKIYETWHEPNFGVDLSDVDLSKIVTYIHPRYKKATSWDDVPLEIKDTFEKLGVPQAERMALSGVGAQYDSEVVY
ncbi:MAG TPA: Fe-S cluster assembly protein SufB, partial [Petrotogaceae bacterium]|nr:Fe-S cluster assembly protein SufB [Petrotogaceae bacterium]